MPGKAIPELNQRQEKFAQLIVAGTPTTDAYCSAYGTKPSPATYASASRLLTHDKVKARISSLRAVVESIAVLSLAEKRKFLRDVVTTPVGHVDENNPLAERVKHGPLGEREVWMPSKLRAMELDAKLAGELDGERTGANVMVNVALMVQ